MKIADISVSRIHAIIKIEDNHRITVQDNGSKFGTLLKLVRPVKVCSEAKPGNEGDQAAY
jgi:hypothetical protein